VSSDVNVSSQKFNIKLFVPEADGMTELWLRLDSVCIVCRLLITTHVSATVHIHYEPYSLI